MHFLPFFSLHVPLSCRMLADLWLGAEFECTFRTLGLVSLCSTYTTLNVQLHRPTSNFVLLSKTIMSVKISDFSATIGVNFGAPCNFITKAAALARNITQDKFFLPVTVGFPHEAFTAMMQFRTVVSLDYDVVLGYEWHEWCQTVGGAYL
jgi:hypothetical protein